MSEPEPEPIRASDADRERAVARSGSAVGEGRLTLAEFSDRVDRAYAARTQGELVPLTMIGGHSVSLPDPAPSAPTLRVRLFSLIGGVSVRSSRR